ncbi:tyrosine-protein kinase SgK223-like protein [Camelus ferus]|nr:tyrosine-protein kinase SgK223-like protein [Camelus ferus]
MHQTLPLNPENPKMSACSDFVEHIWKPGSCKNCFCLRSDHQLVPSRPQPRSGSLPPPPRLPPRPESCRPEDDGVSSSPYSKPTIAVKPTMMSSDASDGWTEAGVSADGSQVIWRRAPGKLPLPKQEDVPVVYLGSFRGIQKPVGPSAPADGHPRCPPACAMVSLQSPEPRGERNAALHPESFRQKLATFAGMTSGCHKGPGPHPSAQPLRESLPSEDDSDQRMFSGTIEEGKQALSFPRECCSQGPTENPPRLGPKKQSLTSEAASSSDGLSCGSANSRASSPSAPHFESDYWGSQPPAHPGEAAQPEPIYAESTKRKKAVPVPSKPQAKVEQMVAAQGQVRTANTWAQKTVSGWGQDREGPEVAPQVAATITVMAAHPEEDHRTIYLSSPDSSVGVQWPRGPLSQIPQAAEGEPLSGQGLSSRESHHQAASENMPKGRPAIPPKLSKSSPGGSPVSSSASPLSDLSEGNSGGGTGLQPPSRSLADPASSCRAKGVPTSDSVKGPPPAATTTSALDQRRPWYQTGAWSRQCRIEEEEEVEQDLLSQSWGREVENGPMDPSNSSTWHRLRPTDSSSGQNSKIGTGMSKSASFAFEFPKDRSGIEAFSPPPPPPKSRHLLKMNKSSSDLEKVSQGSAESLSPSFRGVHVGFTTGSTDSLASDSRTCSDGGPSSEPTHSPTNSGKKLFAPVPFPSGSTEDVSPSGPLQPPPLPQKKLVSRAASSPDGFFWTQGSPQPGTASPKLNLSHSETNVCVHEESHFSHSSGPGNRHHHISTSEPLEKTFKGNGHWGLAPGLAGSKSLQGKGVSSASSSQLSVSSQASTGSTQLQLHSLLGSISSKEGTYAKLGGLYAQSLVRLVAKCEDLFMGGQKKELHFSENNWSLFKLTCNKPCCDSGDAIYYCATCSEDPGSTYAVKICKTPEPKTASYCSPSVPVHFNIQQDCGHFVASEQDCVVVITREVPHQTALDFVRGSATSHQSEPEVYERRVCFLLLQLCNGLEHLKEHGIIHRDLCLENLLLVHCTPQASPAHPTPPVSSAASSAPLTTTSPAPAATPSSGPSPTPPAAPACQGGPSEKHLPRLIISNFLKAKQKPGGTTNLQQKKSQARLAPEIVSASQYRKFDEFQTGILIYELLHQPNPFEVRAQLREQDYRQEDLPPLPALSLYSPGLQQLAHLLLEADPIKRIRIGEAKRQLAHLLLEADPIKRIRIGEAKRVLQCLLWGPRRELVEQPGTSQEVLCTTLNNWIDMKRALMMMKFAEKAVDRRRGVELEDWLCCQYLASAEPGALLQSLKLLQLL